jgi:polyphosphate kinase
VIDALYRAAGAGVKIDLIVRGICCLVPRENIRVLSVIDRFLEHSRIFLFRNGGATEVVATSGDWMPRNFFRRIEVAWPIVSPQLRDRIELQILGTCLADDAKGWRLQPDGTYRRRKAGPRSIRSQQRFIDLARAEAVKQPSYDEAVRKPAQVRRKAKRKS